MKENLKRIKWNVRRELTFLYDLRLECLLFLLFAKEGFGWDFWERKLINDGYFWYFHFCYVVSVFTRPDMEDQDSRRCIVIGFFLEPVSSLQIFFFLEIFELGSQHWQESCRLIGNSYKCFLIKTFKIQIFFIVNIKL